MNSVISKIQLTLGTLSAAFILSSCTDPFTPEDEVQVTITEVDENGMVIGTVASPSPITGMDFDVLNPDGSEAMVDVEFYNLVELADRENIELYEFALDYDTEEMAGAELTLLNLCDGEFLLQISISNGEGSHNLTQNLSITDEGECLEHSSSSQASSASLAISSPQIYILGGQDATEPSALDLDEGIQYNSSERTAHAPEIDLAYGIQESGGFIMTPARAEAANFGDWGGANAGDPLIYNVSSMIEGDLAELTEFPSLEDVDYSGGMLDEIAVENGLIILVISDIDGHFLVQVNNVVDGAAGSITILTRENAE
jgi:hypothetical protein